MRYLGLLLSLAGCVLAGQASAQLSNPAESSGFPGDNGRPPEGGLLPPRPHPPHPPEPPGAGPTLDLALEAARTAVAACAGYHVSVTVIDAGALPKLAYTPDGTQGWHTYMGYRKAYTALTFGRPNDEVAGMAHADPAVATRVKADRNMVVWAGGLPLLAGGKPIGAIGVSGAEPSSKDRACAQAGVDRISGRLK